MPNYSKTPKEAQPEPPKEGHRWLKENGISYDVQPDGVTLVSGDVSVHEAGITQLPFGDIAPWEVSGNFDCKPNRLTSLAGAPQAVGGDFMCHNNQLLSLAGAPQRVGGDFNCAFNRITSLAGAPQSVGGFFDCGGNQLMLLEGAPKSVGGDFWCGNNQLTCLVGVPQSVGGNLWCNDNLLVDFTGLEQSTIRGGIKAQRNPLVSLSSLPAGVTVEGLPEGITAMHRAVQGLDI